jgi:hypothetical protein
MSPSEEEVLRELERVCRLELLSQQERLLLRLIVKATLAGKIETLYQKQLADALGIASSAQIGVVASRLRTKLADHYQSPETTVQIELPKRGYEARFIYRPRAVAAVNRADLLIADAKVAIDQRTLPGAAQALSFLDKAAAADPRHPRVEPLKAYCHATRALYGTFPRHDLEKAQKIIEETRATGERPWESWFAQACVEMALHWNWIEAGHAFTHAIALSGGEAQYQPWYTAFLTCQGRGAEAVALLRASVSRLHDSPIVRADLAGNQVFSGLYDEAEETIAATRELFGARTHYLLFVHLAILREARGDARGALDALAEVPLKWPRTSITLGLRALFSGLSGDARSARRHFRKLKALRLVAGGYVPAVQMAVAALGAGEVDTALSWLRESAEVERDPNMVLVHRYPFLRHIHHEAGFRRIVVDTMRLTLS